MAKKGRNINFRQTPKSLRALRQTKVFSHINRLAPDNMFKVSRSLFSERTRGIKQRINNKSIIKKYGKR